MRIFVLLIVAAVFITAASGAPNQQRDWQGRLSLSDYSEACLTECEMRRMVFRMCLGQCKEKEGGKKGGSELVLSNPL